MDFETFMRPSSPLPSRHSLEADLALARQNGDFAAEAICLISLGDIAKESEEYDLAQGLYGQAWAAYEKMGDQRQTTQAILSLTDVFTRLSWDEENFHDLFIARSLCDEALKISEQAQDYTGQGRALKVKADLIGFAFNDEAAKRSTYEHALKLCEQGRDLEGQADAIMELGIMSIEPETYEQAKSHFSNALNLYQQDDFHEGEASALVRLAEVAGSLKDIGAKKSYYKQALAIYEQLKQPLKVAEMLRELGEIASQEKDYDLALTYHKQGLVLCDRYGEDPNGYTSALFHIGHVYEAAGNYEEACFYYKKQLDLCDEKDTFIFADRLYALGRVYALMGDINTGRQYAHQAIATSDGDPKYDDLFNRILMRWEWGKIEYKAGFHEIGCALCYKAFDLAEKIPFGRHILDVWEKELAAMNCPSPPNSETSHDT